MNKIHTIDLHFQQEEHSIAAYLIETSEGPILIETGPMSTFHHLKAGVEQLGFKLEEIKHVLVTHIHFDHAGAAWKFAELGATIYVHPIGLPHLNNPEKLWNSAAQIYGDEMDRLWGEMQPIPLKQLIGVTDQDQVVIGGVEIEVLYTPGHAVHHNAYAINDVIFTGDVAGVKIGNGPIVPPCPPPDINIELWKNSIEKLRAKAPKALYLTHYSRQENPNQLLDDLIAILDDWAHYIKPFYDNKTPADDIVPQFMQYTKGQLEEKGLNAHEIQIYEYANPSWMSVNGLLRYWKLKEQGRI